jgi:hypothetical protein
MTLNQIKTRLAALQGKINAEMYDHLDDTEFESHLEDLENLAETAQYEYDDEQATVEDDEDEEDEGETEG